MLRSRSVFLILCWNFLVLTVFHYLAVTRANNRINLFELKAAYSGWCLLPVLVLYPLVGLLADTYCGRYRAIKCGMWVMWGGSIFLSLLVIAKCLLPTHHRVWSGFDVVLFTVLAVGLSLFQANIIQFGVDQLTDASSADITSFINWYTWTFFASELVVEFTQNCNSNGLNSLVLPVFLTLAVLLNFLFGKYLVIEPVTYNPFKLLRDVLHYAIKNKYPRQRSAFTYWDDRRFSRIDLAKTKYGGPFSVEEVENVKTFFRILALVFIMSSFIGMGYVYKVLLGRAIYTGKIGPHTNCHKDLCMLMLGSIFVVFLIPVYELMIYPLCTNRLLKLTSRNKFKAGIVCLVVNLVIHLLFHVKRSHGIEEHPTCLLYIDDKSQNEISKYYYLIPIPKLFECFAKILLFGSTLEFVCAQSPYSMKGLLFGMAYAVSGVVAMLTYIGFLPFYTQVGHVNWNKVPMGCAFWFLFAYLVISLILATCFLLINCSYKKRQRSEDLPSEHCFAENYYDCSESYLDYIPVRDASS